MKLKASIKFVLLALLLPSLVSCVGGSGGSGYVESERDKIQKLYEKINRLDSFKDMDKKDELKLEVKKRNADLVTYIWNNEKIYFYSPSVGTSYNERFPLYIGKNKKIYRLDRKKRRIDRYLGKLDTKISATSSNPFTTFYTLSNSKELDNTKQICKLKQFVARKNARPIKRCLLEKEAYLDMDTLLVSNKALYKPTENTPYSTDYSTIETIIILQWKAKNMQTIENDIAHPWKKIVFKDGKPLIDDEGRNVVRNYRHDFPVHKQLIKEFRSKNDKYFKKYPKFFNKINTERGYGATCYSDECEEF